MVDPDVLIFCWDPLEPQPHDPDVKALLRLAVLWNIPVACSRASADFLISSPLLSRRYTRQRPDFTGVAGLEPGGDGERAA
jgi:methylglyoxal synthase